VCGEESKMVDLMKPESMFRESTVGIVIPTYNEYHNLLDLLPQLRDLDLHSIYVVDDDSKDGTNQLIEMFPDVKFFVRKNERGLVSAELEGMRQAENDYVVVMDADFSHNPNIIKNMIDYAIKTNSDVVVGSRYIKGGYNGDKLSRKIISTVANKMVNLAFHPSVKDVTSGFRVYSKRAYKFLSSQETIKAGYTGQVDILERLITKNYKCSEFPIDFKPREKGDSKLKIKDIKDFFFFIAAKGNFFKYILVGISGVLVSEGLLYALHTFNPYVAEIVGIEVSITSNFFLNDLWTFKNRKKRFGIYRRLVMHNFFSLIPGIVNFASYIMLYVGGFEYLLANFLGIAVAYLFRYMFSTTLVWGEKKQKFDAEVMEEIED
jgi:dolichol-phosphate mannosyltransferase